MSTAQAQPVEEQATTDITEFSKTEAALAELQARWKTLPDFTQKEGYETGRKGIRELVSLRTSLDAKRLDLNKDDQERIKYRNSEAKRITALLVEMETPLKEAKQAVDDAKEKAKQAAIEAEQKRIAGIKARIEKISALANFPPNAEAATIMVRLMTARNSVIDTGEYGEFVGEANTERDRVINFLETSHSERAEYEAGQAELKRQQEEQQRKQAEIDAQQEAMRKQQEEIDRQQQELKANQEAEAQRKTDEERQQREEKEAAERAEQERIEREQREAEEAARIEAMKPDKVKLLDLAKQIKSLQLPDVDTVEGERILAAAVTGLSKISADIEQAIG